MPTNTQTSGNSFNFEAVATDVPGSGQTSSGISIIEYTFDSAKATANISSVRGVAELKAAVVFADNSYAFATEGVKTFYVRAIDDVGNIGEWVSKSFMYDKAAPSLSIDSYVRGTGSDQEAKVDFESNASDKTFETGKQFTLSGSASDNTGISSLEIWQKKTGTNYSNMSGADAEKGIKLELSASDISNGKWSISGLPRTDSVSGSAATDISSGGTYTYTVIVKDGSEYTPAGGTVQPAKSNTDSVTVNIDKVAPVITIDILPAAATNNQSDLYGEDSIKFYC